MSIQQVKFASKVLLFGNYIIILSVIPNPKNNKRYLHRDTFVPVNDISRYDKAFHIYNVNIASFSSNVQPFTTEWQM